MSDRCEDGRLMRSRPFPDDPYFEHDIGECPECGGEGCHRPEVSIAVILCKCGKVLESPCMYAEHCRDFPDHFAASQPVDGEERK